MTLTEIHKRRSELSTIWNKLFTWAKENELSADEAEEARRGLGAIGELVDFQTNRENELNKRGEFKP